MKFIEINRQLYPINDFISFEIQTLDDERYELHMRYVNSLNASLCVSDVTAIHDLKLSEIVNESLIGKIVFVDEI